jgi:hypothetical protein
MMLVFLLGVKYLSEVPIPRAGGSMVAYPDAHGPLEENGHLTTL